MNDQRQLPAEISEFWWQLTPQQQSLTISRIKALASANQHHAAQQRSEESAHLNGDEGE